MLNVVSGEARPCYCFASAAAIFRSFVSSHSGKVLYPVVGFGRGAVIEADFKAIIGAGKMVARLLASLEVMK